MKMNPTEVRRSPPGPELTERYKITANNPYPLPLMATALKAHITKPDLSRTVEDSRRPPQTSTIPANLDP